MKKYLKIVVVLVNLLGRNVNRGSDIFCVVGEHIKFFVGVWLKNFAGVDCYLKVIEFYLFGQPKVTYFYFFVFGNKNIIRFEVSMYYFFVVEEVEAFDDRNESTHLRSKIIFLEDIVNDLISLKH